AKAIADWVTAQRDNDYSKVKAVLPNYSADSCGVINFATDKLVEGKVEYTAAAFCSRIAGLVAGTPMSISATYAPLPELTDCTRKTREQLDADVAAGKLVAFWDGRKVKLSRAVNSLVTTTEGMLDSFKKIKIVEVQDMIRTDVRATVEDEYIGKYANTYDNKMLLVAALRSYFAGLWRDDLVQEDYVVDLDIDAVEAYLIQKGTDTTGMTEQDLRQADTGTHLFLLIKCKILDAIEDVAIKIEI
ncbi:MAG: phage tail sheath protein, partial [Clostridia bacterium]|nr:phage tail sheath protein [Clostridia bacterium]